MKGIRRVKYISGLSKLLLFLLKWRGEEEKERGTGRQKDRDREGDRERERQTDTQTDKMEETSLTGFCCTSTTMLIQHNEIVVSSYLLLNSMSENRDDQIF